ncbi:MAG: AAA family ATPase, partial [Minisyncoccia bacterium]
RSRLLEALDYYWNRFWVHDGRIKLVVCGSASSWIIDNIINNKGGLYNRVTRTIRLDPFSLHEVRAFLEFLGVKLTAQQILELYMVFGGIPQYLSLIRKGQSASQCIDELCFSKDGALADEFDRLFASLFHDSENYVLLIKILAQHRYGMGQADLIRESGLPEGGSTVRRLKELEESGFIMSFIPHGHSEKGKYYKIIDEFTIFYMQWMGVRRSSLKKRDQTPGQWLSISQSPAWKSWSGYAFEAVCFKHLAQIRHALGIAVDAEVGTWRYQPRSSSGESGAQIDLLFDRRDGAISICEIKHSTKPFSIDKTYADNLLNKVEVYRKHSKTGKQVFISIIASAGLK